MVFKKSIVTHEKRHLSNPSISPQMSSNEAFKFVAELILSSISKLSFEVCTCGQRVTQELQAFG